MRATRRSRTRASRRRLQVEFLEHRCAIVVYDWLGNRVQAGTSITVSQGFNRAPQPSLNVSPSRITSGQPIILDASGSFDADGQAESLLVEWDLDGDGVFDTHVPAGRMCPQDARGGRCQSRGKCAGRAGRPARRVFAGCGVLRAR